MTVGRDSDGGASGNGGRAHAGKIAAPPLAHSGEPSFRLARHVTLQILPERANEHAGHHCLASLRQSAEGANFKTHSTGGQIDAWQSSHFDELSMHEGRSIFSTQLHTRTLLMKRSRRYRVH